MKIGKLVNRYVSAAIAHGDAIERGDYESANEQHDLLYEAYHALEDADKVSEALSAHLNHENPFVRGWVATHMLKFDSERAVEVLRRLSAAGGLAGFDARIVLQEWEKGTLKIPRKGDF